MGTVWKRKSFAVLEFLLRSWDISTKLLFSLYCYTALKLGRYRSLVGLRDIFFGFVLSATYEREVLRAASLHTIDEYIAHRRHTVSGFVGKRPIYQHCIGLTRRGGSPSHKVCGDYNGGYINVKRLLK